MKSTKKILTFILSILVASFATAQVKPKPKPVKPGKVAINYTVSWGPDLKLKGDSPNKILLYENGSFYAITDNSAGSLAAAYFTGFSFGGSSEYVTKINSKLDLVLQKKIETEESEKAVSNHRLTNIIEFNDAIYLITRDKISKEKKVVYFIEKLNLSTLMSDGVKKKIYEVDYSVEKKRDDCVLRTLQHHGSDALVFFDNHEVKKGENVQITVFAVDKNFDIAWKKEITFPLLKGKNFDFDKYINPRGDLYLIAKVYFDDDKKKKHKDIVEGELNFDYHIYMIGKDISTFIDYPFNLKDKLVSQVNLDVNDKGELLAVGFYSDIKKKDRAGSSKGVFYTIIDPETKTIKAQSYKNFETEVFTAGLSSKKAAKLEEKMDEGKKEGSADKYIIRELIPRKDGGSTMIAEEHYIYTVTYSTGKSTRTVTHFVYGNLIITKINAAGEIEWTTVITKNTNVTASTLTCSYLSFDEGNDTYDIFFNDHKDNLLSAQASAKGTKVLTDAIKPMRFVRVVVKPDGTLSKKEVALRMDEDDEKTRLSPMVSTQVNDNEIILYGMDRGKDKFAKITFKDLEKGSDTK
ncbi:MAG TPA: hypothetical protein VI757_04840 [Bacteroidia bacterium]|nr:hypothetical protein [Bacteroidia bacterium]